MADTFYFFLSFLLLKLLLKLKIEVMMCDVEGSEITSLNIHKMSYSSLVEFLILLLLIILINIIITNGLAVRSPAFASVQ